MGEIKKVFHSDILGEIVVTKAEARLSVSFITRDGGEAAVNTIDLTPNLNSDDFDLDGHLSDFFDRMDVDAAEVLLYRLLQVEIEAESDD